MRYDQEADGSTVGYTVMYYCRVCEDFFKLSPIAPLRCPMCYCDARYIIGPMNVKEMDLDSLIQKQEKKYHDATRR